MKQLTQIVISAPDDFTVKYSRSGDFFSIIIGDDRLRDIKIYPKGYHDESESDLIRIKNQILWGVEQAIKKRREVKNGL